MQNSVEERIMQLQRRKQALVKGTLETSKEEARAMRMEDLKLLFQ